MKNAIAALFLTLLFSFSGNAQLNEYKYIIVPKKFDAFKFENQHQTSTLIKFLFDKKGYDVVYEGDYPEDLVDNICLGAKAILEDNSSLFKTKTALVLKNCRSEEIFRTSEGTSKSKDFKKSYTEAVRNAFKSFNAVNYTYTPKEKEVAEKPVTVSFQNDVKTLPEKMANHKNEVNEVPEVGQKEMVEQKTMRKERALDSMQPKESNITKTQKSALEVQTDATVLYAQPIENGYQLVDTTPKIRYKILKTSAPNVFLVEGDDVSNGLVLKKENVWLLEGTTTDGAPLKKELQIKF